MTDKKIVLTAAGSRAEAEKLAQALVDRRLAACVNLVGPVHSVYRWQGKVETAAEHLLIIKTTAALFGSVAAVIRELHSYDLPECIQLPIEAGSADYLKWIEESIVVG
ncbi:MAG TPA: divalent-cation tolerance protein CutA [Terriglobales bacterium]|nr:divalent-cation tolerance protein CutA [Terriglobales bacterium]